MPLDEDLTRYTAPPDTGFNEEKPETEDRPFYVGQVDRRGGIALSNNPFKSLANREMWEMGWEYQDTLEKALNQ